jgi:hypothetical protein
VSLRRPRLRRALLPGLVRAGVVAGAFAVALPGVAQAAKSAHVCASRVVLVESPGGAVTGIVHHGDLLFVLNGRAHAQWWRVATTFGTRGWLRQRNLCARDK